MTPQLVRQSGSLPEFASYYTIQKEWCFSLALGCEECGRSRRPMLRDRIKMVIHQLRKRNKARGTVSTTLRQLSPLHKCARPRTLTIGFRKSRKLRRCSTPKPETTGESISQASVSYLSGVKACVRAWKICVPRRFQTCQETFQISVGTGNGSCHAGGCWKQSDE